ncbi:hypothetical protein J5N97_029077 [Dioscorea zingiberensis]|uniref:PROP1-like PPR domain-containing protein n=1 Tax=Dioscorea zingiberensis TaxID=325984 RepID=A0A9D5C078_9LILI|nr:hypothetical protein J5N97_029077 [Dioscorea zingiberensis]
MRNETAFIHCVCANIVKGNWINLLKPQINNLFTTSIVNQILLHLSSITTNPSLSWTFFKCLQSLPHYHHSLLPTWTMLHLLTRHKHFNAARQLLDQMALREFLSSPSVLSSLLSSHTDRSSNAQILSWLVILYSRSKMIRDALQVFEQMKVNSLVPHPHACSALLNALAKARLTASAWRVFDEMLRVGVVPNAHIFNVMIHVCYKSGEVRKAEELVNEMRRKGVSPDLFSFNSLIALYCKKSMHYEALAVQERMEREGIHLDIVTYNCLIHGYCREGRMQEARRLFKDIKGAVLPNQVTYTTLIDGYCRVNDLNEALKLREEMELKGLYPGVVTYNSLIRKLCKEGKMKAANDLLNEMDERKVEPDNITCNTLINAYCKMGNMSFAWKLRNKMLESGLVLDQFTYKALIHGFCKVQEMDEAKQVLFEMLDAGFSPNYSTFSWLVDGYCNQRNEAAALGIPDDFIRKGLCIEKSVYRAIIRRFCKRGLVDWAQKAFMSMQGKGISGDSIVYLSLAFVYLNTGKPIAASEMLDDMVKKQLKITARIYNCLNASYADSYGILRARVNLNEELLGRNVVFESSLPDYKKEILPWRFLLKMYIDSKEEEFEVICKLEDMCLATDKDFWPLFSNIIYYWAKKKDERDELVGSFSTMQRKINFVMMDVELDS